MVSPKSPTTPSELCILTFQHTERHPAKQGLFGPLNLTARCRSAKLELCLRVSSHLVLYAAVRGSFDPIPRSSQIEPHFVSAKDRMIASSDGGFEALR